MVASKFNGQLYLTTTFESSITVLDEEMTVAKPTKRRSSNVTSMHTSILAVKEFIVTCSCLACREPLYLQLWQKLMKHLG